MDIWTTKKYFVYLGSRSCPHHLNEHGLLKAEAFNILNPTSSQTQVTAEQIKDFIMSIAFKPKSSNIFTFNEDGVAPQDYKLLTGLTKDNFDTLYTHCHVELRSSANRSGRTALGIFLVKLIKS